MLTPGNISYVILQMLTSQHKTHMNSQDSKPPPETSDLIAVGPQKCNLAEARAKDFKIELMKMFRDFMENTNKSINEVCENINT